MKLSTILLSLTVLACPLTLTGCSKEEIRLVCTGSEETEIDGEIKQSVSTQIGLTLTETGNTSGGYYKAYTAVVGTETLNEGFGDGKTIDVYRTASPGKRLLYNKATNSVKIESWNRSTSEYQPGVPLIIKTFVGACKQ